MSSGAGARVGWVSAAGMQQPSLHGRIHGVQANAGAGSAAVSHQKVKRRTKIS